MNRRFAVLVLGVLATVLTGCSASGPSNSDTSIDMPNLDPPETTQTGSPSPDRASSGSARPESFPNGTEPPAADAVPRGTKDCVMVAAGVSSIQLEPLNFIDGSDEADSERLAAQLEDLRQKMPEELGRDFIRLQEVAAGGADAGTFEREFRAAIEPIELWLKRHCA